MTFETISRTLGTAPCGSTPKDCCDALDIDILAVVGGVPAEKLLPCGMRVIKDVVPLSLYPRNRCGTLLEGMSIEFEERGSRREVVAGRAPAAAANDASPELWMYVVIGAVSTLIFEERILVVNGVFAVD